MTSSIGRLAGSNSAAFVCVPASSTKRARARMIPGRTIAQVPQWEGRWDKRAGGSRTAGAQRRTNRRLHGSYDSKSKIDKAIWIGRRPREGLVLQLDAFASRWALSVISAPAKSLETGQFALAFSATC